MRFDESSSPFSKGENYSFISCSCEKSFTIKDCPVTYGPPCITTLTVSVGREPLSVSSKIELVVEQTPDQKSERWIN